jgi:hypothetical protein
LISAFGSCKASLDRDGLRSVDADCCLGREEAGVLPTTRSQHELKGNAKVGSGAGVLPAIRGLCGLGGNARSAYGAGASLPCFLRIVSHAFSAFSWKVGVVVCPDEVKGICPCLQILWFVVCQEIRVHHLPNGHPGGILTHSTTLMMVGVEAQKLLDLEIVLANILYPSSLHGWAMLHNQFRLPLVKIIVLHPSICIDNLHLPDLLVLYSDVSPLPWHCDGR